MWCRRWGFAWWFAALSVLVFIYALTPWASEAGLGALQRWVFRPSGYTWLARPWTALTYTLVHADLSHLLFNLVALVLLEHRVRRIGTRRIVLLASLAALMGAACYTILASALSAWGIYYSAFALVGSSSIVFGLCALAVLIEPRAIVYPTPWGALRLWHLALGLFLISLLGRGNLGGLMAHLGGALSGCLCYWLWIGRGRDEEDEAEAERRQRLIDQARRSGIHSLSPAERKWLADLGRRSRTSRSHTPHARQH